MAGRQGAARGGGAAAGLSPPQIVVHDLAQARAVLEVAAELGVPVQLRSAPDAAAYAGLEYLKALGEAAGHELLIDCGEDAGLVMAALRIGCRQLAFGGTPGIARKLADMALQASASLDLEPAPANAIFLEPDSDASAVCRGSLAARARR